MFPLGEFLSSCARVGVPGPEARPSPFCLILVHSRRLTCSRNFVAHAGWTACHAPNTRLPRGIAGLLLDFGRGVLLDLLLLFETQQVTEGRSDARRSRSRPAFSISEDAVKDPLAELWCALMDALDYAGGKEPKNHLTPFTSFVCSESRFDLPYAQ